MGGRGKGGGGKERRIGDEEGWGVGGEKQVWSRKGGKGWKEKAR